MARLFDMTIGQSQDFLLALQRAGMSLEQAKQVSRDSGLAASWVASLGSDFATYPKQDFSQYNQYLHSLSTQLYRLRDFNSRMPKKLRVPDAWFNLDPASQHVQSVEDLECWFVWLGSLEKTWAFNQKLVEVTHPIQDIGFARDIHHMRLHPTAHRYEPGIHRVRINLVDNWYPGAGRSIVNVRERALATSTQLAAVEAIGAYTLQHPVLYRLLDGVNLPYFDCAGIEQGAGFYNAPFVDWDDRCMIYFGIIPIGGTRRGFAAPSLVS